MILILIGGVTVFWRVLPSKEERSITPEFRRDKVMDCLSIFTVIVFFVCAVFLTFDQTKHGASRVNWTATQVVVAWSIVLVLGMLTYRLCSRRLISV